MSPKAEIIFVWGMALVAAQAITSGNLSALIQLISQKPVPGSPGSVTPGWGWQVLGEIGFVIILMLIADASDDGADMAMWLLGGLTLVFIMFNIGTVQSWLAKIGV